jgi:hypothetical protein
VTPTLSSTHLPLTSVGNDGFGNVYETYPAAGSTSAGLAVTNNSYFSLGLTLPGTFGQLTLAFAVGKGGASGPRGYLVRSSLDNFASDVLNETFPVGASVAPAARTVTVDATGQSSITFRIYIWSPTPAANSMDFRNLTVTTPFLASSAVGTPSLSVWGMLGLAGLLTIVGVYKLRRPGST